MHYSNGNYFSIAKKKKKGEKTISDTVWLANVVCVIQSYASIIVYKFYFDCLKKTQRKNGFISSLAVLCGLLTLTNVATDIPETLAFRQDCYSAFLNSPL